MNTWHLDDDLLGAYRDRTTDTILAASVERQERNARRVATWPGV